MGEEIVQLKTVEKDLSLQRFDEMRLRAMMKLGKRNMGAEM